MIAFVPIRSKSVRIKNKNIKLLWGKPLLYWALKAANFSKLFKKVVVATDSEKYIKIIKSFNFKKIIFYKRSDYSSKHNIKTEYVIKEYFLKHKEKSNFFFLIQVTNPFLTSHDLNRAFQYYQNKKFDSLLSVVPFNRFLWKKKPINYDLNKRPRSQKVNYFLENGSFYITKKNFILKNKHRLSGKIGMYKMKLESVFEIDNLEDLKICKKLL